MRNTIRNIQQMKVHGTRIPMVTAYDYTSAQIADAARIPMILVGDTLGMVVLGYPSTVAVTVDDMVHHARAVVRGSTQALVVGDLPFLAYTSEETAIRNAGRLLQEAGVQAVKLEGGKRMAPIVNKLVSLGIPVMGHIGLTPQSVNQLGGMRVQGKSSDAARRLIEDAEALQDAGAFALVLELVPVQLSKEITSRLHMPTIGIGAGPDCDGQVLVWHDLLGLYNDFVPRHTRVYARLAETIRDALEQFGREVQNGEFPQSEHGAAMQQDELDAALREMEPEHAH